MNDKVNHPGHYGGRDYPYEARKVISAWKLGFNLGNAVKYIARVGFGGKGTDAKEDIRKAIFYLRDEIGEVMQPTETNTTRPFPYVWMVEEVGWMPQIFSEEPSAVKYLEFRTKNARIVPLYK